MPDLRPKEFLVSDPVAIFGILREAEVGRVPARMLLPIRNLCVGCDQTLRVIWEVVFELQTLLCGTVCATASTSSTRFWNLQYLYLSLQGSITLLSHGIVGVNWLK